MQAVLSQHCLFYIQAGQDATLDYLVKVYKLLLLRLTCVGPFSLALIVR